ncbi:MAG: response regulator [Spirochaetales bacterium]|nr:response regulator [Spirochaetales bacterium]
MTGDEKRTIFIVDDNPQNLNILSDMLEAEGYRTRASLSGLDMFESISLEKPDLIILDIHMPKMDGYEVCETLKAAPEFKDIPVIFCSALGETYNIVKAFEIGGVDYITKPFKSQEVLARVRTHIELKKKKDELEQALESLKKAQAHLIQIEKMTSIGTLVAGIGHEINNPVNYIINSLLGFKTDYQDLCRLLDFYETKENNPDCPFGGEVKALKQEVEYRVLRKEMTRLLDGMYEGIVKVHEVVKSLKLLHIGVDDEKTEVDVALEIEGALSLVRHLFDENLLLEKDIRDLPKIRRYPGRISQVILQLVRNAVDAVRRKEEPGEKEKVTLTARREHTDGSDTIVITVADTGRGMDQRELKQVYDPFYTTKDIGDGVGLGLTTCYYILRQMDGSLEINSLPGKGTEIILRIPV